MLIQNLKCRIFFCLACPLLGLEAAVLATAQEKSGYVRQSGPDFLSYAELVTLSEHEEIPSPLNSKLTALLTTPFVNNEAFYGEARPHRPAFDRIGPGIRVVQWNIERGLQLDNIKLAFTDSEAFVAKVKSSPLKAPDGETREAKVSAEEIKNIRAELTLLQAADVIVLNEVDWGMKRTDYRCVVCELGKALRHELGLGRRVRGSGPDDPRHGEV